MLELLATVHHDLGDLPAAGALWFVTGRSDEPAQTSIAAWRERHGGPAAQWFSIPSTVRERHGGRPHIVELERAASRVVGQVAQRPCIHLRVLTKGAHLPRL